MFLDAGFLTSRISAYYFTHEWILSNSVPQVWEGEATSEQNQMAKAFLNSGRQCSVSETLWLRPPSSSQAHRVSRPVRPHRPGHYRKVRKATACTASWPHWPVIHSIHEIITFLDFFTAIPNPLRESSPLLIFALFTLLKWLSSKRKKPTIFRRRVWKMGRLTAG